MDKDQAERALGIIRQVIENTREDLVAHNWGLIWIVHAFTNSLGFVAIGYWVEARGLPLFWYLVPLAAVAVANLVIVALLAERDRGVRSFVEWQIHGIWVTFIVFSLGGAAVLALARAPATLFAPWMALASGIGFAMMGVVFHRRFFLVAVTFLALAIGMPLARDAQWYLMAGAWWAAMMIPGVLLFRERRRRVRQAGARVL